jgi:hypothetical protein
MSDGAPIFIGGLDRSGKTYMRFMLSSHPHIAISRRTNMWPDFFDRFGDLSEGDHLERCLEAMLDDKHIRSLEPDIERLRLDFRQGPPTYPRLFALIHEQFAQRQGKERWGDQTELIERFAGRIFEAYPHARLIHMIRDPRDYYEASRARRRNGRVGDRTARWLYSVALARQNQQVHPHRYKIVRYETMVSQPEETLRQVCEFLGEAYTPEMLSLRAARRFWQEDKSPTGAEKSPLSAAFIGRYRGGLSAYEIAFIQKYAGRQMLQLGYALEPVRLSIAEKIRYYLVDWEMNVTRMLGWHAWNRLQRKFAALIG